VVEPKGNKRKPVRRCGSAAKGTLSRRRPVAGAREGNLNALKSCPEPAARRSRRDGRHSRYQQAFIEALMQVPETLETCPEPAARSSRRIMIAISKRQSSQTIKRPNTKRPNTYTATTREISLVAIFFQKTTKIAPPKPADQPNAPRWLLSTRHSPLGTLPHVLQFPTPGDGGPLTVAARAFNFSPARSKCETTNWCWSSAPKRAMRGSPQPLTA
jgi:hypothetical protein